MEDDNVYVKEENGNFRPFGVRYNENYLPDGVYFVRHHEGCYSSTNIDYIAGGIYKILEKSDIKNIRLLCTLEEYRDYIIDSDEFREYTSRNSYTIHELIGLILSLVIKKNNEDLLKNSNREAVSI